MKRLLHATALAAVIAASALLSALGVVGDMPEQPYILAFLDPFVHALAISVVVVAIISACETLLSRRKARVAAQAVALVIGVTSVAYGVAWIAVSHSLLASMGVGTDGLVANFLWFGFAAAVLLSWYYAVRERASSAIDALAEESVLRHAALRRADEARLRALRAHVDPVLLAGKLAGIDSAFREGSEAGDRRLDELIDYLTEALRDSRGVCQLQGESDVGFPGHAA